MIEVRRLLSAYLVVIAVGFFLAAAALLSLPASDTTSPALQVVYQLADRLTGHPRQAWGALFALVGLLAAVGAWNRRAERLALVSVLAVQTAWAIGLTLPIFTRETANALAPVAWMTLTATSGLVVHYGRHR